MKEIVVHTIPIFDEDGEIFGTPGAMIVPSRRIIVDPTIVSYDYDWPFIQGQRVAAFVDNVSDLPSNWRKSPYAILRPTEMPYRVISIKDLLHVNSEIFYDVEWTFQQTMATKFEIRSADSPFRCIAKNPIVWVWERMK